MKFAVFVAACSIAFPCAASAQTKPPISKAAEAYAQFLLAHHLEEREDENGAIAAYKRAMELDPQAADIPAELAACAIVCFCLGLYFWVAEPRVYRPRYRPKRRW